MHLEMLDELFALHRGKDRRLLFVAPRGHAKSTIVSLIYTLWTICYQVTKFIVLVSDTEDQAKLHLDAVKGELETNERLRYCFGIDAGSYWAELAFETATGVRVLCRGTNQKVRGLKFREERPGLIVVDDPENDELIETEERRRKLKRWFYGALLPCLAPEGRAVVVGNILHEDSLLRELLDAPSWKRFKWAAIENGKALWPEVYSLEKLKSIEDDYRRIGQEDLYWREYHNQLQAGGSWIEGFQYVKDLPEQDYRVFMTCDPAYSETETGTDFTAFVITAVGENNKMYVIHAEKGRYKESQKIKTFMDLYSKWRPVAVGVQKQDWERSLKQPLQDEMRRSGISFQVTSLATYSKVIKGLSSKKHRIERLGPKYKSGEIVHWESCIGLKDLEGELKDFPRAKHDDLSDALAAQLDLIWPPKKREAKVLGPLTEADPVSGY